MWEMLGLVVLAAMVLELKDARTFVTTSHVVLRPWDVEETLPMSLQVWLPPRLVVLAAVVLELQHVYGVNPRSCGKAWVALLFVVLELQDHK